MASIPFITPFKRIKPSFITFLLLLTLPSLTNSAFRWNEIDIKESRQPSTQDPIRIFKSQQLMQNPKAECEITGEGANDVFKLVPPYSCQLYQTKSVDREEKSKYRLKVYVKLDRETLEEDSFYVNIIDVNDNKPEFIGDKIFKGECTERLEAKADTQYVQVTALDEDDKFGRSAFGQVIYSIVSNSESSNVKAMPLFKNVDRLIFEEMLPFKIGEASGVVSKRIAPSYQQLASIDRELYSNISFPVKACDNGGSKENSYCDYGLVFLKLLDSNDNGPQFGEQKYTTVVEENIAKGDVLFNLSISDSDQNPEYQTSQYSLVTSVQQSPDYKFFDIKTDPLTGNALVISKGLFDFETKETYTAQIKATNTKPSTLKTDTNLNGYATLVVTVYDVDEQPFFPQVPVNIKIPENAPVGSKFRLGTFQADDPEQHNFTYFLKSVERSMVEIDNETGTFKTLRPFDREMQGRYDGEICVKQINDESKQTCAALVIEVVDVNDNAPILDSPSSYPVCGGVYYTQSIAGDAGLIKFKDADIIDRSPPKITQGRDFPSALQLITNNDGTASIQLTDQRDEGEVFIANLIATDDARNERQVNLTVTVCQCVPETGTDGGIIYKTQCRASVMALTSMFASGAAVAVIFCFAMVFIVLVYKRLKYDASGDENSRTRLNQASGDSKSIGGQPLLNSSGGNFSNQSQFNYAEEGGGVIDGNMTFPRIQQQGEKYNYNNDSLYQFYTLNKDRVQKYAEEKDRINKMHLEKISASYGTIPVYNPKIKKNHPGTILPSQAALNNHSNNTTLTTNDHIETEQERFERLKQEKHLLELKKKLAILKQEEEEFLPTGDSVKVYTYEEEPDDPTPENNRGNLEDLKTQLEVRDFGKRSYAIRESSLSTIASQSLGQDDSTSDTYAYINAINNSKFQTLKKIYAYDQTEEDPKRYSPGLFNKQIFGNTMPRDQSISDDIYCPRAIMQSQQTRTNSIVSTPNVPNVLTPHTPNDTQKFAKITKLNTSTANGNNFPQPPPQLLESYSNSNSNNNNTYSNNHNKNQNNNNSNNCNILPEVPTNVESSISSTSFDSSNNEVHPSHNHSQHSKSTVSCSSGIHSTSGLHSNSVNLQGHEPRLSAFTPIRKFKDAQQLATNPEAFNENEIFVGELNVGDVKDNELYVDVVKVIHEQQTPPE